MLRGINVSGHNMVKMPVLVALFEALGHTGVSTYIQSGNVVFTAPADPRPEVAEAIEARILADLGFTVPVVLRTGGQLADVLANCPYNDVAKVSVTFLASAPSAAAGEVAGAGSDQFTVRGSDIYLYCPNGYGRTKLNNGFWERRLKVSATTRNWKTVTKLSRMAESNQDDHRR